MVKNVIIVPETHWDREWYEPFQKFRHKLVKLIDTCLAINQPGYFFLLDGQTVVLEDYLDIKPENKEALMAAIRERRIGAGPWYLLPDEWLAGAESFIRNLERAYYIGARNDIPLMPIGYLPDCFGHTRAVPQILADLTNCKAAVAWRGVPPSLKSVPFMWKSHESATASIPGIYLPEGYGNFANAPEIFDAFKEMAADQIATLDPFSPVPVYLFMNGSDHLFPQPFLQGFAEQASDDDIQYRIGRLDEFADLLQESLAENGITPPVYAGEFRSFARAHLLHSTLSSRMWIKIWNQKNEDLLTGAVEPLATYAFLACGVAYPSGFLEEAWKWHLQNQPHDSICGCSVDEVHEEMKARDSFAQSIGEAVIEEAISNIQEHAPPAEGSCAAVFNGTSSSGLVYVEVDVPDKITPTGLKTPDGKSWRVQQLGASTATVLEATVGTGTVKLMMKLATRKIMGWYINEASFSDGKEPGLIEVRAVVDKIPIGEFDVDMWKKEAERLLATKKYKKVHVIATQPVKNIYCTVLPLRPWAFTKLEFDTSPVETNTPQVVATKTGIETPFFTITFNKKAGGFDLIDHKSGVAYKNLHVFEDFGDRGDEYTFGRLGPESVKVKKVSTQIKGKGPVFIDAIQTVEVELFKEAALDYQSRVGKVAMTIESRFRFYSNVRRVDVETKLVNMAKDHRLRVCFTLPFTAKKTQTATHFGTITRDGDPEKGDDTYLERPEGIQPEKHYIRVDDPAGATAITLANIGLPEVELVSGSRLALTLIRAVGNLSRGEIPERPMHAGPAEATPGAQELGTPYTFNYSLRIHDATDPLYTSDDFADSFCVKPRAILFQSSQPDKKLLEPVVQGLDPWIRVSSLRVREGKVLITMFNLADKQVTSVVKVPDGVASLSEVKIDLSVKKELSVSEGSVELAFEPHEIKMVRFD